MSNRTISVKAPAKVNLFLDVLGKRADGLHDISTVMIPVSLCDDMTFRATDGTVEIQIEEDGLPFSDHDGWRCGATNLATRAAELLKRETGYRGGAAIHLRKRIPVGGGLGGGSADAAAALRALNEMWRTGLGEDVLVKLATKLGSDVPGLVMGGAVEAAGTGAEVRRIAAGPGGAESGWWMVLVNPGFPVSTKDIYSRHTSSLTSPPGKRTNMLLALTRGDVELAAASLYNGLQVTTFGKYPLLAMLAEGLCKAGALGALLCGSGASVLGLARSEAHARSIAESMAQAVGPGLWARVARTLPDGVMAAHGPLEARV